MKDGRIEVAPGVSLAARRRDARDRVADGSAAPFVLVHGLASNARTWDGVASRLADLGHPSVAVDLRGHGLSDRPAAGYDFATVAGDVAAVIRALGLDRPIVAGQSWGADVALEVAARHGEDVRGVACVDGGFLDLSREFPVWEEGAVALAPPVLEGMPATELEARIRSGHPDWSDAGVAATMANFEIRGDGTVAPRLAREHHMTILRALWERRTTEVLASADVPVLLLPADTGDADWTAAKRAAAGRVVSRLADGGPDGGRVRVRWFAPADHDIHVQHPGELAGVLHAAVTDGFFA